MSFVLAMTLVMSTQTALAAAPKNTPADIGTFAAARVQPRPSQGDLPGARTFAIAASSDTSLSSLLLSAGDLTPAFASDTTGYTSEVPNAVAAVTLLPTASVTQSTFAVTNTAGTCEALGCPLDVGANVLTLTVTAEDAVTTQDYVVVVTREAPIATQAVVPESYLKASNTGADTYFGASVAVFGDTLIVGASSEDGSVTSTITSPNNFASNAGAAYVYARSGSGWQQTQMLKSPSPISNGYFGASIAIDGDTLVVGEFQVGAAHVFTRTAGVWAFQTTLTATNGEFSDKFGFDVAIDGDTIVVGASEEAGSSTSTTASSNNDVSGAGAAYVFTRSGDVWTQQAYLKAFNAGSWHSFGIAVDVSGDTVVVGARQEGGSVTSTLTSPNDFASNAGAAYVFTRSASTWTLEQYLKAADAAASHMFGVAVAIDGDALLVGTQSAYATYLFAHNGVSWTQQTKLEVAGTSVAIDDELAVIANPFTYEARVYSRNGAVLTYQANLTGTSKIYQDQYGSSVAFDGNTVVVGAPQEDGSITRTLASPNEFASNAGAVHVFQGPGSTEISLTSATLTPAFVSTTQFYTAAVSNATLLAAFTTHIGWRSILTTTTAGAPCDSTRSTSTSTSQITFDCILAVGANVITFTVNDGAGTEQDYVVTIGRGASDAGVNSLTLSAGDLTPAFVSTTTSYVASVNNAVASLTITPTRNDPNASYVVANAAGVCPANDCPLSEGANTLTVTVTAQDGVTTQSYVVIVTRAAAPTPTPTSTPTPGGPTPTSTPTPGGPTATPTPTPGGPTPTPAPTATPGTVDAFVSPKSSAVTTSTVSIISFGGGLTGAKRVSVNGIKMFHVVRGDKKIDFTMKPGVAGATVDVVLVKADDTVITFTNAYTFEGPTRASGSVSAGAVLTTASGVTITVPPQVSARPAAPAIAGSLVITYVPVEFPAEPPGDVPLSFFEVGMDVDGIGVSTLTNPAMLELPVDPLTVPAGQIARLFEWVVGGRWSPVPSQAYDPAAGIITAPIQRLGNYVLVTAPAHQWWFPVVTLE